MSSLASSFAFHAYALGSAAYLACLVRPSRKLAWVARGLSGLGLVFHGVALGGLLLAQGGMPLGLAQGFSVLAFLSWVLFLALDIRYRMPAIGAFLGPLALAVLCPGLLIHGGGSPLPEGVAGTLLPVHIAIALLGVAAFAVAAGVGVMYLLMERQVKGKRFGLLFSRLPPLQVLDELNRWLVIVGFIALSVTLITGVFFATGALFWSWGTKEIATLIAWGIFAVVLEARLFAGWRGKRVAVLTMAGFALVLVSLITSYPHPLGGRF